MPDTFSAQLDRELHESGWTERDRHFTDACAAARRGDTPAFNHAITLFNNRGGGNASENHDGL